MRIVVHNAVNVFYLIPRSHNPKVSAIFIYNNDLLVEAPDLFEYTASTGKELLRLRIVLRKIAPVVILQGPQAAVSCCNCKIVSPDI